MKKKITEKAMLFLEEHIPELADIAVKQAFWRALASGSSVLECQMGVITEIFPDGTRKFVKKIKPPTPVIPGYKYRLR